MLLAAALSSLPHLDIERLCRGGASDKEKNDYQSCASSERSAESALRQNWPRYPAKVRNECAHVMSLAPEASYVELQTCIESQAVPTNASATPSK
jgi:hypothetical protein